jgi:RHS repeat-associated protein
MYRFTDQELDPETGLYNYDARLYDPVIGRFVSADNIIKDPYDPQTLNRYAYALNNPLKYEDPDGNIPLLIVPVIIGGAIAADLIYSSPANAPDRDTELQDRKSGAEAAFDAAAVGTSAAAVGGGFAARGILGGARALGGEVIEEVTGGITGLAKLAKGGGRGLLRRVKSLFKDEASKSTKRFSDEKQALVDMAKKDKRSGITPEDMQAYKDLNKELFDPFPSNKVRGPEIHPDRNFKKLHGHVGPVDHIPIKDK